MEVKLRTKIPSMFAALAVLMLVVSLVPVAPTPVKAEAVPAANMQWFPLIMPTTAGAKVMSGTEVSRIAVGADGTTVYAINRIAGQDHVWVSTNMGMSWTNVAGRLTAAGARLPALEIAVAPDDPRFVVVVDSTGVNAQVPFLSTDAGANWVSLGLPPAPGWTPGTIVTSIAISPKFMVGGAESRLIAIASADPTAANRGDLFIRTIGPPHVGWTSVPVAATQDYYAVAFSPRFGADRVILAITHNGTALVLNGGVVDITFATPPPGLPVTWNRPPLFPPPYPVPIAAAGAPSPGLVAGLRAGLALPKDYLGTDRGARRVWVFYESPVPGDTPNADLYRVDDTVVFRLDVLGGLRVGIASIAYHGTVAAGKLAVGLVDGLSFPTGAGRWAQVRVTKNPGARFPDYAIPVKPPTGSGWAQVGWSPDGKRLYAGTGHTAWDAGVFPYWRSTVAANDESAFNLSLDDGVAFDQISIIDTVISGTFDLAPIPDSKGLFTATWNIGANAESVWFTTVPPTAASWIRKLCLTTETGLRGEDRDVDDRPRVIVSPDYLKDFSVWFFDWSGDAVTQQLLVSRNGGTTWMPCVPNLAIQDIAFEDKDSGYAVSADGRVSRTIDGGLADWSLPVDTLATRAWSITTARTITTPGNPKGHVFVGGHREAAVTRPHWSTDFGRTWARPPTAVPVDGNIVIAVDSRYPANRAFYLTVVPSVAPDPVAVPAAPVWRWVIPTPPEGDYVLITADYVVRTGIAISAQGVLYVSRYDVGTRGGADRTLTPHLPGALVTVAWDLMNVGPAPFPDATFRAVPNALKISGCLDPVVAAVDLWAIDTSRANQIFSYGDTIAKVGPALTAPAEGALIAYDPVSGRVVDVRFTWSQLSNSTCYQIQIAFDKNFDLIVYDFIFPPDDVTAPAFSTFGWIRHIVHPGPDGAYCSGDDRIGLRPPIQLLAGKEYFWRVRARGQVTGDGIRSPWSVVRSFKTETGVPISAPFPGPQALGPAVGARITIPHDVKTAKVSFSWSPEPGTVAKKYKIVISTKPDLKPTVAGTPKEVTLPAFEADLAPGTYYWQVQAIDPVGNPSAVFNFTIEKLPAPPPPPPPPPPPVTPDWVWVVIAIGALLIIVTLILIVRTGRRV